ncbi:MAG: hypothetical protein AVDCRST_MAG04-3037, partial [uncultured Acetobacteraceae bacterium]
AAEPAPAAPPAPAGCRLRRVAARRPSERGRGARPGLARGRRAGRPA